MSSTTYFQPMLSDSIGASIVTVNSACTPENDVIRLKNPPRIQANGTQNNTLFNVSCGRFGSKSVKKRRSTNQFTCTPKQRGNAFWIGVSGTTAALSAQPSHAGVPRLWPLPLVGGKKQVPASDDGTIRVMVMMSDTGGGHRASAEALSDAFAQLYGNKFKVSIVDMWKNHTPWPVNTIGDSYNFLVKHSFLWRMQFRITEPSFIHKPWLGMMHQLSKKKLSQAFDEHKPHIVVSVHPAMQHVPLNVLRSRVRAGLQKPIPFTTVVTDLTECHPTWFHPNVTACFVPTEVCRNQALRLGLKNSQLIMHGLPIRPQFSQKLPPKWFLRKQLGMDQRAFTVMLAGGGEGMGNLEETVIALSKRLGKEAQVVVICGRNKKLKETLEAGSWPMKVVVRGFVNNMSEWMAASDCLVTKAGPGTIAEALIRGVPLILNGCVPCQEEGNIPFVLENKVGEFCKDPTGIANIIADWFGDKKDELKAMAERCKALGRPDATFRIVEDLAALAEASYKKVRFLESPTQVKMGGLQAAIAI